MEKHTKKIMALVIAAVALVVAAAIIAITFFCGPKENKNINHEQNYKTDYTFYLKDKELYYMDFSSRQPIRITEKLINHQESEYDFKYPLINKDGSVVLYSDKTGGVLSDDIYYRSLKNIDEAPKKIDSNVYDYFINEAGDIFTYIKNYDSFNQFGDLYQYKSGKSQKISEKVKKFRVSKDGNKIWFVTDDNYMFLNENGKEVTLSENFCGLYFINDNFDTVYFDEKDDNALYKLTFGKEKEKISNDVSEIIAVYENGAMYYEKHYKDYLINYVEDDMKEQDAAMAASGKSTAEKEKRDKIRQNLEKEEYAITRTALCYYDGKTEKVISDNYKYLNSYLDNMPIVVYSDYKQNSIEKIKLSEINKTKDVKEAIEQAIYSEEEVYIGIKENKFKVEKDLPADFIIEPNGKAIYFIDILDADEETNPEGENYAYFKGDLYKMDIKDSKPTEPTLYDRDVYELFNGINKDGNLYYFKDEKNGYATLYVDKAKIDTNVDLYFANILNDGKIVYMTDLNENGICGTLKIYDGQIKTLGDNVYFANKINPNEEICYLSNYDEKTKKGDMYIYDQKSEKVDVGVSEFLWYTDMTESGYGCFPEDFYGR